MCVDLLIIIFVCASSPSVLILASDSTGLSVLGVIIIVIIVMSCRKKQLESGRTVNACTVIENSYELDNKRESTDLNEGDQKEIKEETEEELEDEFGDNDTDDKYV